MQGTLNSIANTTFTVQYFANAACDPSGNGEGQTFLSEVTVTTGSDGNVTLPLLTAPQGTLVTATATSPTNDTSEFSNCVGLGAGAGELRRRQYQRLGAGIAAPGDRLVQRDDWRAGHHLVQHPGSWAAAIPLQSALPNLNDPVVIDGTTQPGYNGSPLIEIDGANAGQIWC